jgi:hypothetical protein
MKKQKQKATKAKPIRPDREAIEQVEQDYANASPSEKYRLAPSHYSSA